MTAAFIEDAAAVGQRDRAGSDPDHAVARLASQLARRPSDDVLAAVDEDDLPLNHLRLRTGEKFDQADIVVVGDVSAAGIAGGLLRQEGIGFLAEEVADGFGVERAGRNAIDPHTPGASSGTR